METDGGGERSGMLEKLKRRLPDAGADQEALLADLLEDAGKWICAYTCREQVPEALEGAQVALAAVLYNRMGMEGETGRDEGGVNRTAQLMPEDVACQLRPWRRIRTVQA